MGDFLFFAVFVSFSCIVFKIFFSFFALVVANKGIHSKAPSLCKSVVVFVP